MSAMRRRGWTTPTEPAKNHGAPQANARSGPRPVNPIMNPAAARRVVGLLCAFGAPLCWSVGGAVMRSVDAGSWEIVFWRSASHALVLGLALAVLYGAAPIREFRRAGGAAWLSSAMLAGVFLFHVLAIANTTVANVLILQSTSPVFVALFAAIWLGERLDARGAALMALAFAGLVPVTLGSLDDGGDPQWVGNLFALVVAGCATVNTLVVRHRRAVSFVPASVVAGALAAAIALVLKTIDDFGRREVACAPTR
jgi:drug/metabolite transporter (DMT)-like permease